MGREAGGRGWAGAILDVEGAEIRSEVVIREHETAA